MPCKTRRQRDNLRERMIRQQSCCWYCGVSFKTTAATFEHILPRSRGGSWHKANLRLACNECNAKKRDVPLEHIVLSIPRSCRQKPRMIFSWELQSTETEAMIRKTTHFEYDDIPAQHRINVQSHAMKIHESLDQNASGIVDIGNRLHVVKKKIGVTLFNNWLKAEFRWSQPTASNYMRVAEKFAEYSCIGQFQISALYMLIRKRTPEQAVKIAVERAQTGKIITRQVAFDIMRKVLKSEKTSTLSVRPVSVPKPNVWHDLRSSIRKLSLQLDEIVSTVSYEEIEDLANELLRLTVQIRSAKRLAQPVPKINDVTEPIRQRETSLV